MTKFERDVALLECYYYKNKMFYPKNYILKNAHKLRKIPKIVLVHGRFDAVCSFTNSHRLYSALNPTAASRRNCMLIATDGGHSLDGKNNEKAVQRFL